MPQYVTMAQAAELINTPHDTIRHWISSQKLRAFKPGRRVLVRVDDLQALVEGSEVGALRAAKARAARPRKTPKAVQP